MPLSLSARRSASVRRRQTCHSVLIGITGSRSREPAQCPFPIDVTSCVPFDAQRHMDRNPAASGLRSAAAAPPHGRGETSLLPAYRIGAAEADCARWSVLHTLLCTTDHRAQSRPAPVSLDARFALYVGSAPLDHQALFRPLSHRPERPGRLLSGIVLSRQIPRIFSRATGERSGQGWVG